jgi:hypothetical protein
VIGGGSVHTILRGASHSTIGGGSDNEIQADAVYATIGGGDQNTIRGASYATIGGGGGNNIHTNAVKGIIAGGGYNTIGTNSFYGSIGGGSGNTLQADGYFSTIGGGYGNVVQSNAHHAVIGGGEQNTLLAGGAYATIPGGRLNAATNYAFAAGRRAKARHDGAFVWGDSTDADVVSTNDNSVTIRAAGGYRLFSNASGAGVFLAAGGGSWTSMSDRNAKENLAPVDAQAVLDKVTALPLTTWNYKSQDATVRHLGPMAQDFKAAFGLGETETGITSVDADGVALAAIQGLNQKLEQENAKLRKELEQIKQLLQKLTRE